MKHSLKIIAILISMFFVTQLIGLFVVNAYASNNDAVPFGLSPPEDVNPTTSLASISFAIVFAVLLMFLLMKFRTEWLLRLWFFLVITLALGITINALFLSINLTSASIISLIIALPLAFLKVFRRGILVHNLTELLIYPGIAVIFVPLLNLWTVIMLLILISLYDMYAVWQSGFMQKMAKYQIQTLKIFSGFFIPYLGKKERDMLNKAKSSKGGISNKKIKVNLAILGGGDVVFPIILAGVVLRQFGLFSALIVSICATLALAGLFYISKKGKFYPAMPFISAGCFIGLGIISLLQ
ncbi:MAG TPA: presenilin family intramembrane aspartyl protease [Candidatus Nanoarchaeia archaeon]|nr:presenilin family intramembrane aspartyl protease [Candidatus Nanoarchaeia archaeon]